MDRFREPATGEGRQDVFDLMISALARPLAPALKPRLDSLTETYRYSRALRFSTTTPKAVKPRRWIYNGAQRAGRIQSAERAVPTRQKRKSDTNLLSA
jgi:hypothetical protein